MYEWIDIKRQKIGGDVQVSSDKNTIASAVDEELEKRNNAVEQEATVNSNFEKDIMSIMASANKVKGFRCNC